MVTWAWQRTNKENNNHDNSNDRSHRSTTPTESNLENNSPQGARWQAHSYGMELEHNSSFFSEQHQEGIVDESPIIYSFYSYHLTIIYSFYSSIGFHPYLPSSINYHFRQLYLFRNNTYVGNIGGAYVNSASATATAITTWGIYISLSTHPSFIHHHALVCILSQSSIALPTESFPITLPPLLFSQHQEVSIIDFSSSPFPTFHVSLVDLSYQDSTVIRPSGSLTVSALNDFAPTSFPGSPNLLLISENVRTISRQPFWIRSRSFSKFIMSRSIHGRFM